MEEEGVFNVRIPTTQLQNNDQSQLQSIDPNFVSPDSKTPLSQTRHVSENKLQVTLRLMGTTNVSPAVDHSSISVINAISDDVVTHVDAESKNAITVDRDKTANALSGYAISAASDYEVNTNSDTAVTINSDNAGNSIDAVTANVVNYNNENSSSLEDKNFNKRTGTKRKRDRGEKFEYQKEPYADEEQEKKGLKALASKENREKHETKVKQLEMKILDLEARLKARGETSNASVPTTTAAAASVPTTTAAAAASVPTTTAAAAASVPTTTAAAASVPTTTAAADIQENIQSLSPNNLCLVLQVPDNENNQTQECITKSFKEENEHLKADNANLVNICIMIINECNNKDGIITKLNERINLIEQELTQKNKENEALKIKNTDQEKTVVQQNNNIESLKQELANYKLVVEILRSKLNNEVE